MLNILVLHNLGDPLQWRESMVEKELCLPLFAKENNYCVHDCLLPLPPYVKGINFDAIILTQTFLSKRMDPTSFKRIMSEYSFVKDSIAYKIALPQDDYTCCAILDRWMVDWKVDIVYPVCVNNWDILYPLYSKFGRLCQGYTGYISNRLLERTKFVKPIELRTIDVSYRAARLSPVYGRMGFIKSIIGDRFEKATVKENLNLNLSTNPKDSLIGSDWYNFIENSKCMIGVNSGASMTDPEGKINLSVHYYLQRNPKATFEEVEAACFSGLDEKYIFTAISPRNYECALLGTVQLLTPGPYGGFINPWEHYIPLEPDMSNIDKVLQIIKDNGQLEKIASACRAQILSFMELRYDNHVTELINQIRNETKTSDNERASSINFFKLYKEEMSRFIPAFWRKERMKRKVRQSLAGLGARKIKYFIMNLNNLK